LALAAWPSAAQPTDDGEPFPVEVELDLAASNPLPVVIPGQVGDPFRDRTYPKKLKEDPNQDEADIKEQEAPGETWLMAGEPPNPLTTTGLPGKPAGADFRAATWNLFRMTVKKATRRNPFTHPDFLIGGKMYSARGGNRADLVLRVMQAYDVDIVGFQEVYLWQKRTTYTGPDLSAASDEEKAIMASKFTELRVLHPLLRKREQHGYTFIPGAPIYNKPFPPRRHSKYPNIRISWEYWEYAPIAYRKTKFRCTALPVLEFKEKKANRAACRLVQQASKRFTFVSTHLPAKQEYLRNDMKEMVQKIRDEYIDVGANLIIALDANSHPSGHLTGAWSAFPNFARIRRPEGRFTKIHRKNVTAGDPTVWDVHINKTNRNRYLDDIFPLVDPRNWCVSKWVVPVGVYPMNGRTRERWKEYYRVSDHIPVVADFDVNRTLGGNC